MKIAALYDIHGNLPALEAVLEDVNKANVDAIVIGGDAIAGPMPLETLELLESLDGDVFFLHGNSESDILMHIRTGQADGLTPKSNEVAQVLAETLSSEQKAFIATWQLSVTLDAGELGGVLFCHATPESDTLIFTSETPSSELDQLFSDLDVSTVVCGHTHMQFDRQIGSTRVINAGSVGMPFGEQGAFWLLLDGEVQLMRTSYDFVSAADRISKSGSPDAASFAKDNVLAVPSAEQALKMMDSLREKQILSAET